MLDNEEILESNRLDKTYRPEPEAIAPTAPDKDSEVLKDSGEPEQIAQQHGLEHRLSIATTLAILKLVRAYKDTLQAIGFIMQKWSGKTVDLNKIQGASALIKHFGKDKITMVDVDRLIQSVIEDKYTDTMSSIEDVVAFNISEITQRKGCF